MASALSSNSIAFLLDDRNDFWFAPLATAFCIAGWRCSTTEWFGPSGVASLTGSAQIADAFLNSIRNRLKGETGISFVIVTDSEFGPNAEAGAGLLHRIMDDRELGKYFHSGVVYSSRPLGPITPGRIERLVQKASQLEADARVLVEFFQTGEIGVAGRLVSMVERLCFFDWMNGRDRLARCSQIFRPVVSFGYPDKDFEGECFCDPILEGVGEDVVAPFSASTVRWFESDVFESMRKLFDPRIEVNLIESIKQLCPCESLSAAAEHCRPESATFGAGSLRLLWDAAMSGNNPSILEAGYYPLLERVVGSHVRDLWVAYLKVFKAYTTHKAPQAVFEPLWASASAEVATVRKAVNLARERGLT